MNKTKITVPYGDKKTKKVEGYLEVTGIILGPFVIHRTVGAEKGWTVTHARTGFAIQQYIPTQTTAMWLAGELNACPVWDFSERDDALKIPEKFLERISKARVSAMTPLCLVSSVCMETLA